MTTFPPERILVPLDLSDTSFRALSQAMSFADAFGATIEILHARPRSSLPRPKSDDQAVTEIRSRVPVGAAIRIVEGDPASAIVDAARLGRFGMIVMGSHGRKRLSRIVFGSVARAVVLRSPVPVVVVRGRPSAIHSILAPVAFTDYGMEAFKYAGKLAQRLDSRLTAFHIAYDDERPDAAARRLRNWVNRLPRGQRHRCRTELRRVNGSPAEMIVEAAEDFSAVVLAVHRHGALRNLALGTTAEQVLLRCPAVPVVCVPASTAAPQKTPTTHRNEKRSRGRVRGGARFAAVRRGWRRRQRRVSEASGGRDLARRPAPHPR